MTKIITRDQWGARHADGSAPAPVPWQRNRLHHSVTLAPDIDWIDGDGDGVQDDEERAVRLLEQIGQDTFGAGISYTTVIPPSGRRYQGHSIHRRGTHTYQRNDSERAIVFIGNYETHQPTRAQIVAAALTVAEWHLAGHCPEPAIAGPHSAVYATTCPGRHATAAIPEINRLALAHVRGEINLYDLLYDLEEADDLSEEGSNILAFIATGGASTRVSSMEEAKQQSVDPTSLFGRVLDMQLALTAFIPFVRAVLASGVKLAPEQVAQMNALLTSAITSAVDSATEQHVIPALTDALGDDADVRAIATATAEAVKTALGQALTEGPTQ